MTETYYEQTLKCGNFQLCWFYDVNSFKRVAGKTPVVIFYCSETLNTAQ